MLGRVSILSIKWFEYLSYLALNSKEMLLAQKVGKMGIFKTLGGDRTAEFKDASLLFSLKWLYYF